MSPHAVSVSVSKLVSALAHVCMAFFSPPSLLKLSIPAGLFFNLRESLAVLATVTNALAGTGTVSGAGEDRDAGKTGSSDPFLPIDPSLGRLIDTALSIKEELFAISLDLLDPVGQDARILS